MKNTMKDEDLKALLDEATIEGICGCAGMFLRSRHVEWTPDGLVDLVEKLTEEFDASRPKDAEFCLPDSILKPIVEALSQAMPHIDALNQGGEADKIRGLVRVITGGEAMIILDKHSGKVIDLYNTLNNCA